MSSEMKDEGELSFEEAWAAIELMDVIVVKERKWLNNVDYGAYIPIKRPNWVVNGGDPVVDSAYWGGCRAYYARYRGASYKHHRTPADAKKALKANFRKAYRRTSSFRVAVNQFLKGE